MIPAEVSLLDVGRVEGKITPSTACRFIREGKRVAMKRLTLVLEGGNSTVIEPEKHLNKIYLTILKHSSLVIRAWRDQLAPSGAKTTEWTQPRAGHLFHSFVVRISNIVLRKRLREVIVSVPGGAFDQLKLALKDLVEVLDPKRRLANLQWSFDRKTVDDIFKKFSCSSFSHQLLIRLHQPSSIGGELDFGSHKEVQAAKHNYCQDLTSKSS
jgi:hypothetical protein